MYSMSMVWFAWIFFSHKHCSNLLRIPDIDIVHKLSMGDTTGDVDADTSDASYRSSLGSHSGASTLLLDTVAQTLVGGKGEVE